jgi:hypothetical protein
MYKGNFEAWGKIGRAEGFRGVFTGWSPTFVGYSVRIKQFFPGNSTKRKSSYKEDSNMEDMNTLKSFMEISPVPRTPTNIRPVFT